MIPKHFQDQTIYNYKEMDVKLIQTIFRVKWLQNVLKLNGNNIFQGDALISQQVL